MFLTLILISFAGRLVAIPLDQTDPISVCNSSTFKYYHEDANNVRIYYQCDPWGDSLRKECTNGTVWNNWLVKCDLIENFKNLTLNIVMKSRDFDCRQELNECVNQGVCNKKGKCECLPQFTGEKCQTLIQSMVEDILSQNFNLTIFKQKLAKSKSFINASYYEKYRNLLDNDTYDKLNDYLDMFEGGVRFDFLVNSLVEKILEEIYPDTEFLAFFYPFEQTIGSLLRLMPNMLSYSRYSADRYEYVFEHFKNVLVQLVDGMKIAESNLTEKATTYKSLTLFFLNQTIILSNGTNRLANKTVESMRVDQERLVESLKLNFNSVVNSCEQLFDMLENFHINLINQFGLSNSSIYEITFEKSGYDQIDEVFDLLIDIKKASKDIWNNLNNFAFWFITNFLSNI